MAAGIFDRQPTLKPAAMQTVAERRFGDANALRETGDNARANGVAYLAEFVIEILLKARLVGKFRQISRKPQHAVAQEEREIWLLIWKRHDLEAMLEQMPELEAALLKKGDRDGIDYLSHLKRICGTWTIHARYTTRTMLMSEASELLDRVRMLKEVLK